MTHNTHNALKTQLSLIVAIFLLVLLAGAVKADDDLIQRIPLGDVAQDFALPDSQGETYTLKQYRGQYVLVMFWTMNCHYCKEDMASLEVMYPRFKSMGLEVIAIHAGDKIEEVQSMLKVSPLSYPVLLDLDLALRDWGIPAIPTVYIVDPQGNRLYRVIGSRNWSTPKLSEFLESTIKQG